jgi:hypothetical protein
MQRFWPSKSLILLLLLFHEPVAVAAESPKTSQKASRSRLARPHVIPDERSLPTYGFPEKAFNRAAYGSPRIMDAQHKFYPCPPRKKLLNWTSDLDHVLQVLHAAPLLDEPYRFLTFMCDVWPEELHARMVHHLPKLVGEGVKGLENGPCNFTEHCGNGIAFNGGCQLQLGIADMLKYSFPDAHRYWPTPVAHREAMKTWRRVEEVLQSSKLWNAIWEKLHVLEARGPEAQSRLIYKLPTQPAQSVHTDSPNTVATMAFPITSSLDDVFQFGTCFHRHRGTHVAGMKMPRTDPPCTHQTRHLPNSAFAFRTVPSHIGGTSSKVKMDFFLRKHLRGGTATKKQYRNLNVSYASWHRTPLMRYDSACNVKWRLVLFLTFPCEGDCRKKWSVKTARS